MLGKLIKNSFKGYANAVYGVYIVTAVIGAVMAGMLFIDWSKNGDSPLGLIIKIGLASLLCISALIVVVVTLIKVLGEFNRNMYEDEGYLTLSLPVNGSSLLLAKWLTGSFWVILSYIILVASGVFSFLYCLSEVEDMGMIDLIQPLIESVSASAGIVTPSIGVLLNIGLMYAFEMGVVLCVFVLICDFASTMSHCHPYNRFGRKGRLLWFLCGGFAAFVIPRIVTKLIKIYIVINDNYYTFTLSQNEVAKAWKVGCGAYCATGVYCLIIFAIFLFVITANLIDSKVNAY